MNKTNTTQRETQQPWTEKYRPTGFSDIVLDPLNRQLFANIIRHRIFPNLILYGPGGTGKTTTAMALIHSWYNTSTTINGEPSTESTNISKSLNHLPVIVLNASDDRGIDVIRNQIQQFAQSKNMFDSGYKFVILDEVDAMTKTAQNALKIILQTSMPNVRFCLICNYISRIDDSLRNEFISVRFQQLPPTDIFRFIRKIADSEGVKITDTEICAIQKLYNADIRSMINFIQLHQYCNAVVSAPAIIVDQIWEDLHELVKAVEPKQNRTLTIKQWMHATSATYNVDLQSLCTQYFMYMLTTYPEMSGNADYLQKVEMIVHSEPESDINTVVDFFVNMISNKNEYDY